MRTAILSADGNILYQTNAVDLQLSTDRRGYAALRLSDPGLRTGYRAPDSGELPLVRVHNQAGALQWEGVLNTYDGAGLLTAVGIQALLKRLPYTALWVDNKYSEWTAATSDNWSGVVPNLYQQDNNNRLYMALREGGYYWSGQTAGYWYIAPDKGARQITRIAFNWNADGGGIDNFKIYVWRHDADGTMLTLEVDTVLSSGGTGSVDAILTGCDAVSIEIYCSKDYAKTDNTAEYLRITELMVATDPNQLSVRHVFAGVAQWATAALPGYLLPALCDLDPCMTTTPDIDHALYEDRSVYSILDDLALLAGIGWRVMGGRIWGYTPEIDTANAWTLTADQTHQDVDGVIEVVAGYAGYSDPSNRRRLRTATVKSPAIGTATDWVVPSVNTTSSTVAALWRDAALSDATQDREKGTIEPVAVSRYGAPGLLSDVRAGDTGIYSGRPFLIGKTTYNRKAERLTIEPWGLDHTLTELLTMRKRYGLQE